MRCGCNCNLTLLCRHLLWFLFCEAMIVSSRFVAVRAASTWKLRRDGRQAEGGGWLILPALFVLTDFLANEGDDFHRHGRSTRWMTTLPAHSALCRHLGEDGLVIGPIRVKLSEHELERLDRVFETDRYESIGVGIGQRPE